MTIIDTHVHLYDISDPDEVLRASFEAGLSDVVALGVDLASNKKHFDIAARQHPLRVHLAAGIHPGMIVTEEIGPCFDLFRARIKDVVAIGETGLDFSYKWVSEDKAKKDEQRAVFQRHLDLAKEFDLPIVVHARGAWQECLKMTVSAGIRKAVFHWYSGPLDVLKGILDAGFYLSVSPAIEYSPGVKTAAQFAPIDRILVETDTPTRGWMPRDVWRTLKMLAAIKGVDEEKTLSCVNATACKIFGL